MPRQKNPINTRRAVMTQKHHTEIDWNRFAVDILNHRTKKDQSQDELALAICVGHNSVFRAERGEVVGANVFAALCFAMCKQATAYLKFPDAAKVSK